MAGLHSLAGDPDGHALASHPSAQVRLVVRFVGVGLARAVVAAAVGIVSRLETGKQGLQPLAVMDVAT